MRYNKEQSTVISFPLGGIGSGCIGLTGNGTLIDWEIFNRPSKGSRNGLTHFAVRAEEAGKAPAVRILNGDYPSPYNGERQFKPNYTGFGFGPEEETLANWPHFPEHEFNGNFPVAEIDFKDNSFPARSKLSAWSVMIPGESKDSSLPAAFFDIELTNTSDKVLDYTVIGVLTNPWSKLNKTAWNEVQENQLTTYSGDDGIGDVTLTLDEGPENISYQTSFYRGLWRDHQEMYYNDIMAGGRFADRKYPKDTPAAKWESGLLAAHFRLQPGETRTTRFMITWSIPVYEKYWDGSEVKPSWKNYYATVWRDSKDSGKYACQEYERLRKGTFLFSELLQYGNLPEAVKNAASSCLAVLKSPTCLRLEDGTFYGWEGVQGTVGSCEGSCSHVWGYQQALPFLFPDLERSMRQSHLCNSVDENGGSHFRLQLPLGTKARITDHRPCADGQFGDVMKIYRDWLISGDDDYIRRWWPTIRKTVEYAWSPNNPDRWDPEQTGILYGRQHHTLDMELYGPNAWLSAHYLGALDAAARMADFMTDDEFAAQCRAIRAKGIKYLNDKLYNGEYFCQNANLTDYDYLADFGTDAVEKYWNDESKEIKYQIVDGCGVDAPLAQMYATLYGLAPIFDKEKLHSTLQAIYKYNFKCMRDVVNLWRIYALNDEKGVLICTWPHNNKPAIPITYNSETMTGFEYAFAVQLAAEGFVDQAIEVTQAIRDRFDGRKRNPWNEIECGSNYARSMTAYGLIPALSGFTYDRRRGMLGFAPKFASYSSFWALGGTWGKYDQDGNEVKIELAHGSFELKELNLAGNIKSLSLNGKEAQLPLSLNSGDVVTAALA